MNNYTNQYEYAWFIESDCDNIHVKSNLFQTEACCYYLKIAQIEYNGDAELNTVIEGSSFLAKFSSDENFVSVDFHIYWSCYYSVYNQTGSEGILWIGNYDNEEEIEWIIDSDCSSIHLMSTHFDIEEGYDFLVILPIHYDIMFDIIQFEEEYGFLSMASQFEEEYDFLSMASQEYTGTGHIDATVEGSSFVAIFNSDDIHTATGFTILWSCLVS